MLSDNWLCYFFFLLCFKSNFCVEKISLKYEIFLMTWSLPWRLFVFPLFYFREGLDLKRSRWQLTYACLPGQTLLASKPLPRCSVRAVVREDRTSLLLPVRSGPQELRSRAVLLRDSRERAPAAVAVGVAALRSAEGRAGRAPCCQCSGAVALRGAEQSLQEFCKVLSTSPCCVSSGAKPSQGEQEGVSISLSGWVVSWQSR